MRTARFLTSWMLLVWLDYWRMGYGCPWALNWELLLALICKWHQERFTDWEERTTFLCSFSYSGIFFQGYLHCTRNMVRDQGCQELATLPENIFLNPDGKGITKENHYYNQWLSFPFHTILLLRFFLTYVWSKIKRGESTLFWQSL